MPAKPRPSGNGGGNGGKVGVAVPLKSKLLCSASSDGGATAGAFALMSAAILGLDSINVALSLFCSALIGVNMDACDGSDVAGVISLAADELVPLAGATAGAQLSFDAAVSVFLVRGSRGFFARNKWRSLTLYSKVECGTP